MSAMIAEIFGPTVQGEGPNTGKHCAFVRFGRCNLSCSWCDTPYTWDWRGQNGVMYDPTVELRKVEIDEIVETLADYLVDRVVITGGEPLMQATALAELADRLLEDGYSVEVETNGTRKPLPNPEIQWNVSPKLAHSGDPFELRINFDALALFRDAGAIFKFVCESEADLEEVAGFADKLNLDADSIWIMPEGKTPDAVAQHLALVADGAIARGWNISGRLHVSIWGDTRGK